MLLIAMRHRHGCWPACMPNLKLMAPFVDVLVPSSISLSSNTLKYAQILQRRRLDDALEAKRQQENFIDMTSHEVRNPLSAMVQCADAALTSLNNINTLLQSDIGLNTSKTEMLQLVELGVESLETIISCCAHSKSIVDDVLTLSKLDAKLLATNPMPVRPITLMQEVVRTFKNDAQKAKIQFSAEVDDSLGQLGVEYLLLDPVRVKQILFNLISNAIKFTLTQVERRIRICVSASIVEPESGNLSQSETRSKPCPEDANPEDSASAQETLFLRFSVADTGKGLSSAEMKQIFHKWSQASPKTHTQYGGSGLGLFITKHLTELQGGRVDVVSAEGKGSTFSFYIRTRREVTPAIPSAPVSTVVDPLPPQYSTQPGTTPVAPMFTSKPALGNPSEPRLHVLVVEDNKVNQKVLCAQLRRHHCDVSTADNGLQALEVLRSTPAWQQASTTDQILNCIYSECDDKINFSNEFTNAKAQHPRAVDIVLMDMEMPVLDGIACTRAIRKLEANGVITYPPHSDKTKSHLRLPIISISANARQEQNNAQIEAGVDDAVAKPFRIAQLMAKVHRLAVKRAEAS